MMTPITDAKAPRKRATIHTLGCRLNQSESTLLETRLRAAGYDLVPFGEAADLAVVHTCTVTREADAKSRKAVRQFNRQNPEAYTAVIGCYAQMGADALAKIEGVDLIIGNQEKLNVLDYVTEEKSATPVIVRDRFTRKDFTLPLPQDDAPLERRANLKIQDGCDFMCSFCIIPFARGRARSRALPNLLEEARQLVARGVRELVLTGVNIGLYDWERKSILHVVEALNAIPGLDRIRISSIEPTTIPDELLEWMADLTHKLTAYLHIPLQSGSNAVLDAMGRKYSREEFRACIQEAHAKAPGIGIGTDILVGFPGETDQDFEDTCDILVNSSLFYAHVFKYSERAGTASVRIADKVSPQIAARRSAILREWSVRKTRLFQEHHLGKEVSVLFEYGRDGWWEGYTENYLRVRAYAAENFDNKLATVALDGIEEKLLRGAVVSQPVEHAQEWATT